MVFMDKEYVETYKKNHPVGSIVLVGEKRRKVLEAFDNFARIGEHETIQWTELARQEFAKGVQYEDV